MASISRTLLVLLSVALSSSAGAQPARTREAEREALRRAMLEVIERGPLRSSRLSVQVRSLDDGAVVFARDADELLNPASNVKLVTAAAALVKLGPDYRFETEFFTEPEWKDGKARTLWVRGRGDPTLSTERLYGVVGELVHLGLKEVGDLVLDESFFDGDRLPPGYDQESGDRAYLAPTGALSLNSNVVGVYVRPAEVVGARAVVEVEPASEHFVVEADAVTGQRWQRRFTVTSGPDKDRLRQKLEVKGVVPLDLQGWSAWKKVDQPALYLGATLKELLKQRGVKVRGKLRLGVVPEQVRSLHVAHSETLDLVLKRLNKHSSNFVAEQLVKTLGAEERGVPGSTASGLQVVEEFLEREAGLPRGSYVMRNGSGLNDANRFSAAQLDRLLQVMVERFPLMPEYLSALGIAGKDGTVRTRFEGSDAVGRLRAKTGTLESVSALSGYVQAVGGERFVFSILVNDFPGRASSVVPQIDALGAAVAASSGTAGGPAAAVAALAWPPPSQVGSFDELLARLRTYQAVGPRPDRRAAAFLRTGVRSERDPAVRAFLAEALYRADPRDAGSARLLLESAQPGEDTFGRLCRAAAELGLEPPLVGSLKELASAGNPDAAARLLELARATPAGGPLGALVAEALAAAAADAPQELLQALKALPPEARDSSEDALVAGLLKPPRPVGAFWQALREAQGSVDPELADFSRALEGTLARKVASARAPAPVTDVPAPPEPPPGTPAPGG